MKTVVVLTMLALFWQQSLVGAHALGRPAYTSNMDQLKSLLERLEETLTEEAQREDMDADYEETNQQPQHSQPSRGWSLDQEGDQVSEGAAGAQSQRNRLKDLLLALGKRASSCFGARMDRIGNISGLGCNSGKG